MPTDRILMIMNPRHRLPGGQLPPSQVQGRGVGARPGSPTENRADGEETTSLPAIARSRASFHEDLHRRGERRSRACRRPGDYTGGVASRYMLVGAPGRSLPGPRAISGSAATAWFKGEQLGVGSTQEHKLHRLTWGLWS